MLKSEIRKLVTERKRQHSDEELMSLSLALNNVVAHHPRVTNANIILLYYSIKGEVDTHKLVDDLNQEENTILLPRVKDSLGNMEIARYFGRECLKPAGSFHILEPQGEPFREYEKIDVAIVPGIAFTKDGRRLGRGGGYYDRLLPLLGCAYKIGICFPFQLLDDIPTDSHDVIMDEVVALP